MDIVSVLTKKVLWLPNFRRKDRRYLQSLQKKEYQKNMYIFQVSFLLICINSLF